MEQEHVIDIASEDNTLILTPNVDLSDVLAEALIEESSQIIDRINDSSVRCVIVDLHHSTFMGTDFIGLLLKFYKRAKQHGSRFLLCNVAPPIRDSLGICELDRLWPIYDTLDAALAA